MTGSVLSTGDGHQGWQDKLSIMMVLELSICLKTGAMTLKTVLDKGYGSLAANRGSQTAADCWQLRADGRLQHQSIITPKPELRDLRPANRELRKSADRGWLLAAES